MLRCMRRTRERDPQPPHATYIKAPMRRAMAFEQLDDVDHALQADLEQPILAERQEKLKDEMLGKLKDLGNTILGKFGLNLDNFKAERDVATGGYSSTLSQ
ncbi:hypothetical protein MNEG_0956 [Monoraphidium neglectum]|uniref:Uncharacterized protein n=1 Tax=Monoraphidium neglectum TaxID=145388 RepID=A0A0D2K9R3_9CHLO|nr:hypothetical protein MNEG_0956 [Monoraphidium neglectum]KIZ06993.1 hypothetical protein MNEG_0956 [Monoraphidium neglectum]|eukprot:XP_013906012.1 hypothetical protein MNEG_0956 [Monoraphidium neglectum]